MKLHRAPEVLVHREKNNETVQRLPHILRAVTHNETEKCLCSLCLTKPQNVTWISFFLPVGNKQ